MTNSSEGPFFNLKAVVQQTGLKPDTLRAWERRYGLPTPHRSSGGHRLYTRYDIETLKWLTARQQEGLSIARAVDLWRQIEAEGQDPLAAPASAGLLPVPSHAPPALGATLIELREDWISACLAYDEQRSEQALAQAFALYSPETVALELLQAAMSQIGDKWYRGEATVQQEHFCSALANRRLEALIMASPPPTRSGRILIACPPQEQHVFGLLLLTFLLRRRGWDVIYLGANVPVERLETTLTMKSPHLVVMAAQRLTSAASLLEAAQFLQAEGVPLAYGGLIFNLLPASRARIPGHFLGERLPSAPDVVEVLMAAPHPVARTVALPEAFPIARDHFEERRGQIEADLARRLGPVEIEPRHLAVATRELASNIDAALALGDMDFLSTDLDWLRGLLSNHYLSDEALIRYLGCYHQAASQNLNGRAEPVLEWLSTVIYENGLGRGNEENLACG